jgi:autotransporter-associated beta strand protein
MILSALAVAMALPAYAAPPDLTVSGAIAALKGNPAYSKPLYTETYNLGATGLRGWIHFNNERGNDTGAYGFMTETSRQILVTVAEAPGNVNLAVNDVILGVTATSGGEVPLFSSDCRKEMGVAIGLAEAQASGILRVKRWRASGTSGVISDVTIAMEPRGSYSATTPFACTKSNSILTKAKESFVTRILNNPGDLSDSYNGAINAIALLAVVTPADPYYTDVQTALRTYARALAARGVSYDERPAWALGYTTIFLSEYYLRTLSDNAPDTNVLQGIQKYTSILADGQSRYGTYGHGLCAPMPDGGPNGSTPPYGPINSAGTPANIAIILGKKALVSASIAVSPNIDQAIERGAKFLAYYVNKGSIPYGENEPWDWGHSSNGKDAMSAVLFGLLPNRAVETEYFARMTVAGHTGREYGHTGQEFSYLWGVLGANVAGQLATTRYLQSIQWQLDLARRTDGSFTYWGSEQYGAGRTADGTYLGSTVNLGGDLHASINPTACYLLSYGVSLKRICLTGKEASTANSLNATKVEHAMNAATYKHDCVDDSISQLMTALSDYDPITRNEAAIQLGTRADKDTQVDTLLSMAASSVTNERIGACQALGQLRPTSALPLLSQRLSDSDLWVRAVAAKALRNYGGGAISQVTPMLTALAANATDPDVIVWNDPIQIANGFLSNSLAGGSLGSAVVGTAKNILYPAVKAALAQPDSRTRETFSRFTAYFPLVDVQMLAPEFLAVASTTAQADVMWHQSARQSGISVVTQWKAAEAMPVALAMQYHDPFFGWNSYEYFNEALTSLASFGDAARWTLPGLRSLLATKTSGDYSYQETIDAIASIESAISSPADITNLFAVANSRVITTTGPAAITLTGSSCRMTPVKLTVMTSPLNGTLTGTAPNLTYTPNLGYQGPDHFTFKATDSRTTSEPATISIIVGSAGNGLKGEYFDNTNFTSPKLTRIDQQINFDWAGNSPASGMGADTFSVRWSGKLLVPETADYTFSTLNSDGVRLFVNGTLVMDKFTDRDTSWNDSATIKLTAGQKVELQMDYYENTGSAVAKLKWTGPSLAGRNGAIITKEWLYDQSDLTESIPFAHNQNFSILQNTNQPITLSGSVIGQTPLTYGVATQPSNGTLTGTAPNLIYNPSTNYSGVDTFTYIVSNGVGNSVPATVSISILSNRTETFFWRDPYSRNWSNAPWTNTVGAGVTLAASGGSSYILNFNKAGRFTTTHNLNTNFAFNQLNFATAASIIGTKSLSPVAYGTLLPQINQNSGNRISISSPLNLTVMTTLGGLCTGDVTLSGVIAGGGGLTVSGSHRLVIPGLPTTAANTYSGGTIVNTGILHLGSQNGGTNPLCVNPAGAGSITLNPGGTIELDRVSLTNSFTANGGILICPNSLGAMLSGLITLNDTLTISAPGGLSLTKGISGRGGLVKADLGLVNLTGINRYTGTTLVKAGVLQCSAQALGTGPLDITSGAKVDLNYTGTRIISSLKYNGGSALAPGTYGSSASPAVNSNDVYFSGTGTITIGTPPESSGPPVISGLVLQMDASQISGVVDGAQLDTWFDSSGSSNNAIRQSESSSGYPKYIASGLNGLPVVRFNSGNSSAGDYLKFTKISTIRNVFWVIKENAGLSDGHFLLGGSDSYDFHRGVTPNGTLWNNFHAAVNIKTGITRLMGETINGTTSALPAGSFQLVSLGTSGNVSADQICQDRVYHGSWQGDIAEILIYDRALTVTEEAQVGTYLATKYGLTTSYPSSSTTLAAFKTWASNPSQGLTQDTNNGPMDDPDRDGISNLLEFTLGGAPMTHSRAILPVLTKANSSWIFSYARSDLSLGNTTQIVEYSNDLQQWTPITINATSGNGVSITAGSPSDTVSVTIPATAGKPTFARLKVGP